MPHELQRVAVGKTFTRILLEGRADALAHVGDGAVHQVREPRELARVDGEEALAPHEELRAAVRVQQVAAPVTRSGAPRVHQLLSDAGVSDALEARLREQHGVFRHGREVERPLHSHLLQELAPHELSVVQRVHVLDLLPHDASPRHLARACVARQPRVPAGGEQRALKHRLRLVPSRLAVALVQRRGQVLQRAFAGEVEPENLFVPVDDVVVVVGVAVVVAPVALGRQAQALPVRVEKRALVWRNRACYVLVIIPRISVVSAVSDSLFTTRSRCTVADHTATDSPSRVRSKICTRRLGTGS